VVDPNAPSETAVVFEERLRVIVHLPVGHEDEELAVFETLDFLKQQKDDPAEPVKVMGFTYSAFVGSALALPGEDGSKGPVFQGMWWDAALGGWVPDPITVLLVDYQRPPGVAQEALFQTIFQLKRTIAARYRENGRQQEEIWVVAHPLLRFLGGL